MLLFMVKSKDQQLVDIVVGIQGQENFNFPIDMLSIGHDFSYRWPCHQSPLNPGCPVPRCVVIAVEQVIELGVEFFIRTQMRFQYKCLKKPGRMCKVPFDRTNVFHSLNNIIFCFEVTAQVLCMSSNFYEFFYCHGGWCIFSSQCLCFAPNCSINGDEMNQVVPKKGVETHINPLIEQKKKVF